MCSSILAEIDKPEALRLSFHEHGIYNSIFMGILLCSQRVEVKLKGNQEGKERGSHEGKEEEREHGEEGTGSKRKIYHLGRWREVKQHGEREEWREERGRKRGCESGFHLVHRQPWEKGKRTWPQGTMVFSRHSLL